MRFDETFSAISASELSIKKNYKTCFLLFSLQACVSRRTKRSKVSATTKVRPRSWCTFREERGKEFTSKQRLNSRFVSRNFLVPTRTSTHLPSKEQLEDHG